MPTWYADGRRSKKGGTFAHRPLLQSASADHALRPAEGDLTPRSIPAGSEHQLRDLTPAYNGAIARVQSAFDYAPGSRSDVQLRCENGSIRIDVADQGHSMSADEVQHVFDRFYRGPLHRGISGSGLGLPIARSAIERASGTLVVESEPEHGSRFIIRLPRVES